MTNFPDFRPAEALELKHGEFPGAVLQAESGRVATVQFSRLETNIEISREFYVTRLQWLDIRNHFETVGTHTSFLFDVKTLPASYTPSGYRWRYKTEPKNNELYQDFFLVSCEFVANYYPTFQFLSNRAVLRIEASGALPIFALSSPPPAPVIAVQGLANGSTTSGWIQATLAQGANLEVSLNSGSSWQAGDSSGAFRLPEGTYSAGVVQFRQVNSVGASSATLAPAIVVDPPNSATIGFSCAAGATVTGTVTLVDAGMMLRIRTSHAGWLRLYGNATALAADASRLRADARPTAAGVHLNPVFTGPGTMFLSPLEGFANEESPTGTTYQWRFTNDGSSGTVVITFVYRPLPQ